MQTIKRQSLLINLLLTISTLIGFLLIAEIFLRLFFPLYLGGANDDYIYDKELGFSAKPGHRLLSRDYQLEMYVNNLGTANFQKSFDDYQYLIYFVGDSFTQGVGVPADASLPFQLDLLLNLDENGIYKKKFGVVNLGLAGRGGEQNLIALKRYIAKIGKPNFILYFGCDNDYDDDIWFRTGNVHKSIIEGSPYWGNLYYPAKWILVDLEIGKRIKLLVSKFRRDLQTSKHKTTNITEGNSSQQLPSAAELEIDIINRASKIAEEYNAHIIFSWANESPSYDYLKKWSYKTDTSFADWSTSLKSLSETIPDIPLVNQHSGQHHRTYINMIIAKAYAREIKKAMDINYD